MNALLTILFWVSLLGLFYIYAGYPLLIAGLARWRPRPHRKSYHDVPVSVVVVAHNEAAVLAGKIRNVLEQAGGSLVRELVIASDGSTDRTAEVVESYPDSRVKLMHWEQRRGKPSVLNDVVPHCGAEIVVLTDARQQIRPAAIRELGAHFADEEVGVVSGELVFRDTVRGTTAARGLAVYWEYEKFIRRQESRYHSVPGATGALYALRRKLYKPLPPMTLLDDVAIPMQIVQAGYRCLFEEKAVVLDEPSTSPREEGIRKRRTIAGNVQLMTLFPAWLLPWKNPAWLQFLSHKISRLCSPLLLVALAVTNAALAVHPFYAVVLAGQGLFYLFVAGGWVSQRVGLPVGWLGAPFMFVSLNYVTLQALYDALRGRYAVAWERSRSTDGARFPSEDDTSCVSFE